MLIVQRQTFEMRERVKGEGRENGEVDATKTILKKIEIDKNTI